MINAVSIIANHTLKDAQLVQKLMFKLQILPLTKQLTNSPRTARAAPAGVRRSPRRMPRSPGDEVLTFYPAVGAIRREAPNLPIVLHFAPTPAASAAIPSYVSDANAAAAQAAVVVAASPAVSEGSDRAAARNP